MTTGKSLLDPSVSILIVDDNPHYAKLLSMMLARAMGYQDITTVESTERARDTIRDSKKDFGLLFVDYNFPSGETGGQFLEYLAGEGLLETRTAFLITAEPTLDNFKQALDAGAVGIVAKPFDSAELKKQIEKAERERKSRLVDSF